MAATPFRSDEYSTPKLVWWILGIAMACLITVGGYVYADGRATTRSEILLIQATQVSQGERLVRVETNYSNILDELKRINNKLDNPKESK